MTPPPSYYTPHPIFLFLTRSLSPVCVSVRNNNRFREEDCLREKSRASFFPLQFPCRPMEGCMFKKTACHLNPINKSALNLPTLKIPHNVVGCSEKYTTYCKRVELQGTPPTCSHLSNKSKTQMYLQSKDKGEIWTYGGR